MVGEAAEFLRWTAREAPAAAGYWPAPAVANHALAGEAVIDFATAFTTPAAVRRHRLERSGTVPTAARRSTACRGWSDGRRASARYATATPCWPPARSTPSASRWWRGADQDGDVLVLCGTTLIVWATIPEAREVPGLWTIPHTAAGKSQIGGRQQCGRTVPQLGGSPCGAGDTGGRRSRPGAGVVAVHCGVSAPRTTIRIARAVLDGLDLTHGSASVRRAAYEASGFVVRQLIELSGSVGCPASWRPGGGTRVQPWMQAIADATGSVPSSVSACAGGCGAGRRVPRPDGGRPGSRRSPTPPGGRRSERVVEPDPRGPTRSRTATPIPRAGSA